MKRLSLFIPMTALILILFAACGSPEEIAGEIGATAGPTEDIFAASTGRKPAEARGRTSDRTSTRATPAVRGESARESSNRARPTPGVNLNEVRATPLPPAPAFVKAWGIDPKIEKQTDGPLTYDYVDPPSYAEGEFYKPVDIAVAYDGSVYVSDFGHSGESGFRRIQKSTSDGEFTQYLAITHAEEWITPGSAGPNQGMCNVPPNCSVGIVTGPDVIFVLDDSGYNLANKYALMEFTSDGVYQGNFDFGGNPYLPHHRPLTAVAVDVDGNVYILSKTGANKKNPIYKYTSEEVKDGSWYGKWKCTGELVKKDKVGTPGGCDWSKLSDIAVGPDGSVYVLSPWSIDRLAPDGSFISQFGTNGTGPGEFKYPRDIAVAPDGSVYVVDRGNSRIQKFTSDGVFVTYWGSKGTGNGQFHNPESVAVAPDGSVYVLDRHRVQKFSPGS